MISQRAEGGAGGRRGLYPDDPAGQQQRQRDVRRHFDLRFQNSVVRFPEEVAKWYPGERAKNVKYAEAFVICEYGRQPDLAELKRLFPFYE
jgi:hypothetical protein